MNDNVNGRLDQTELDIEHLESEGMFPKIFHDVFLVLASIFSDPDGWQD